MELPAPAWDSLRGIAVGRQLGTTSSRIGCMPAVFNEDVASYVANGRTRMR
jgi:hypothetical protein